ncbi:MAG: class I SAM-dependent methyltransferase [Pseudomonadota bacterium]
MASDPVREQYETYPYPHRDPEEERTRLLEGSPSNLLEVDHYLFRGRRDWSQPFRVLVAGCGTGDGLIQLATHLQRNGFPAEILAVDLSDASLEIARKRAEIRSLESITFQRMDLIDAVGQGPFDYIDCCGVLHHLEEPDAGFRALSDAVADDGGLGLMVYAPFGRAGVYEMQDVFRGLLGGLPAAEKVETAREMLADLPAHNAFAKNSLLRDHEISDAGLYDLLLHSQDRAYTVSDLVAALDRASLSLVSFLPPAQYDLSRIVPEGLRGRARDLPAVEAMALAEKLRGDIKVHNVYVAKSADGHVARPTDAALRPILPAVPAVKLGEQIARKGQFRASLPHETCVIEVPKAAGVALARADGTRTLGQIAAELSLDWMSFQGLWGPLDRALVPHGLMLYSRQVRR